MFHIEICVLNSACVDIPTGWIGGLMIDEQSVWHILNALTGLVIQILLCLDGISLIYFSKVRFL